MMKRSRLHLDLFKVFHDLAQTESFSKTAARNYLTQSAVSQQVAFLERLLGKRLAERGKGKFHLTEEGEAFRDGCRKIMDAYQEAVDKIQHKAGEISGTLKIETIYSIGLHHLEVYVKSYMRQFPRVNLHLEYCRSDRIYTNVIERTCDLGIVAYPRDHPMIQVIPFKNEKLVFVSTPEDSAVSAKSLRLKDLEQRNFVAFERDIPTRKAIDNILVTHGVSVNIVHEFDNIETLKRSIEVGAGVSILPENTILQEVKNNTLISIPISDGPYYRPTGIIRRRGRNPSRAAREFLRRLSK